MKDKSFQKAFEQLDIPKEELRSAIQTGIQKGTVKSKKKKSFYKYSTAAAILTVSMVTTLLFSFPSYAQKLPVVKNVFELFMEDEEEGQLESHASHMTKINQTSESNGVSLTVTEAVYDGESVTVAYTLDSEHDLGEQPFIEWEMDQANLGKVSSGRQIAKKTGASEYAGLLIFDVEKDSAKETLQLSWEGKRIGYYDMEIDPHSLQNPIEGSWAFDITLENVGSETETFTNLTTENAGIAISLNEMATTPISTSFYFTEYIDREVQEEDFVSVLIDYQVTDDLGNSYSIASNMSWGNDENVMNGRVTMTKVDEGASSLTITPIVKLLKEKEEQPEDGYGVELEFLKEPFELESIIVPLDVGVK